MKENLGGYKIVLTSDRTLMSEYAGGIFLGFSACMPSGMIPEKVYFSLFCPSVPVNGDGSVKFSSCGLRKIEAQLLNSGYKREDVIVAHPDYLDKVVGPNTKVLGINETDPLGIAPATSTFMQLFSKREAYMPMKFKEVLNNPAVKQYKPKIIVGGPGAWQLEDDEARRAHGVNCVIVGEGEKVVKSLFDAAVNGETLPEVVYPPVADATDIPIVQGATVEGMVEIARGCGRGCAFCVPTLQKFRCLSLEHILKEVDINIKAGRNPILHAEDVIRYKAKGFEINKDAVRELFSAVVKYPGVKSMGISHFALSSVASAPDLIKDLSSIMGATKKENWVGGQCGIETGSPRLIRELMVGKAKPFTPEHWPQVVVDAFQILNDNNWIPCATLIIGLPGEKEEDTQATMDLVGKLHDYRSLLVPLFMVSEGGLKDKAKSFNVENITRKQAELFMQCWEHNLDWADAILKEYFVRKSSFGKGLGIKLVFGYGAKQARTMLKTCREEYDCNIPAMIKDSEAGKFPVSLPIRLISKVVMRGNSKEKN